MQDKRKNTNLIRKKLKQLLATRDDIAAVYLFGSYGTRYQTPYSDIDLGFIFMPNCKVNLKTELGLEAILSQALGTDNIDLVNLNKSPIQLRYNAIAQGLLIYEKDYIATSNFLEHTIKYYLDTMHHRQNLLRDYSIALKEAYASGK